MLIVMVGAPEGFNDTTNEFVELEGGTPVTFEHSLVSLSKWESKYEKPFLAPGDKTSEEILDYIRMMIISPDVSEETFSTLTQTNLNTINDYITSSQTATTFPNHDKPSGRRGPTETITSELVYYWMVSHQIPFECQHWHLNRLLTLIRVCNVKNSKPKKMSKSEIAARNRELNAQRRAELGTRG